MLRALLEVNTDENERLEALYENGDGSPTTSWYATNPMDTMLFLNLNANLQ